MRGLEYRKSPLFYRELRPFIANDCEIHIFGHAETLTSQRCGAGEVLCSPQSCAATVAQICAPLKGKLDILYERH